MGHHDRRVLNAAIRTARLTIRAMTDALGLSPSALRRVRTGAEPVTPDLLRRMAALLRYQADRLNRQAARLESLADSRDQVEY